MRAKRSSEPSSVLQWLLERGEGALSQALQEVFQRPGALRRTSRRARGAAGGRAQADRNLDVLFHLLNLPTRTDLQKLRAKIDELQGSVLNLSMKVDRLLAQQERTRPRGKLEPAN
jgi:polyhydroxyalkanoate synthesis regulator phasin